MRGTLALVALVALAAAPAAGWNAAGHRAIAGIAYDHLRPEARARADALIRRHPDYSQFILAAPADPDARAKAAFVAASLWADQIRTDPRFYDESRPNAVPTPLLPGFPDMARHSAWHYFDIPFSTDGTPVRQQPEPHALSEMLRILAELARPGASRERQSYGLVWFLHIAADVHQPLHCTSRFLASQPEGDRGGNEVFVSPGGNLHALWDQAWDESSSSPVTPEEVAAAARSGPSAWVREGYELARKAVYTFGNGAGSREQPLALPSGYQDSARKVARTQVIKAGLRVADALNEALGAP